MHSNKRYHLLPGVLLAGMPVMAIPVAQLSPLPTLTAIASPPFSAPTFTPAPLPTGLLPTNIIFNISNPFPTGTAPGTGYPSLTTPLGAVPTIVIPALSAPALTATPSPSQFPSVIPTSIVLNTLKDIYDLLGTIIKALSAALPGVGLGSTPTVSAVPLGPGPVVSTLTTSVTLAFPSPPTLSLPSLALPSVGLPTEGVPSLSTETPTFSLEAPSVTLPSITVPTLSPGLPSLTLPSVSAPTLGVPSGSAAVPTVPFSVDIPTATPLSGSRPTLSVPTFSVPTLSLPHQTPLATVDVTITPTSTAAATPVPTDLLGVGELEAFIAALLAALTAEGLGGGAPAPAAPAAS